MASRPLAAKSRRASDVRIEGEVVEVYQQGGARWAKVVLKSPTVLEVLAAPGRDVHLGDHVLVDGVLRVDHIRQIPGEDRTATD